MDATENTSCEVKVKKEIDEDGSNSEMIHDYTSIDSIKQECKQEVDWDCMNNEHPTYDENLGCWPKLEISFTIPQEERIFQCPECPVKTKYASNLTKHISSMHPKNKCIANNSSSSSMSAVQNTTGCITDNSLWTGHTKKKNLSFQNKKLEKYESVCSTNTFFKKNHSFIKRKYAYSCSNCSFHCNVKHELVFHIYQYHFDDKDSQNKNLAQANTNISICPHCNKNLHRHANPKSHVVYCSKISILQCDYCLCYVKGKPTMQRHIFGKHFKDGIFQKQFYIKYYLPACSKCGKRYTNREHLRNHIVSCGKELPFQCGTCLHETVNKYSLAQHILKQHLKRNNLCQDL